MCTAVLWGLVSSLATNSDPTHLLVMLAALVVGAVAGRWLPDIMPMIVVGVTLGLVVLNPFEFISRDPSGFPFGYANAKGAYLVQAAAAALLVTRTNRSPGLMSAGLTIAAAFAALPLLFDSIAAGMLGLAVLAIGLATASLMRVHARVLGIVLGTIFLVALSTTLLIASSGRNSPAAVGEVVGDTVGERRQILWTDAMSAMSHNPVLGVGPGNFESVSALARTEEDVRWVPSAFLEQGAEIGVPGLVLMVAIFVWAFARLLASDGPGPVTAIGFAALFAIAMHACMDYVLHYPAVPMAAGVLFGSATSGEWEKEA